MILFQPRGGAVDKLHIDELDVVPVGEQKGSDHKPLAVFFDLYVRGVDDVFAPAPAPGTKAPASVYSASASTAPAAATARLLETTALGEGPARAPHSTKVPSVTEPQPPEPLSSPTKMQQVQRREDHLPSVKNETPLGTRERLSSQDIAPVDLHDEQESSDEEID